ncbi:Crp/Fnr family transcriptional regulator [Sulfurimonas lithotrophica]|uniref:Crp/Fnr family transcriptional regulator n=1 Tax=Sulfurimonas lithotrophica TaxID=2590022 RepID=A0A5P8NYG1_9BACT|nr:Crp/Fnr family transcriptional regulator [Sulfurimonas lithotrophica]QFR48473.1 Crp/Fnr family transcriptional regulator [Sulfurimonas lithotrophica]
MSEQNVVHGIVKDEELTLNLPDLVSKKKLIKYQRGEMAFDSYDTMNYFYFVMSGKIKISQINSKNAKEQTINILTRGDMFDTVTLLDGKEHDYISTVIEESEVVEVPIAHVRELIENDSAFKSFFFPYLAKQMRQIEDLAVDLSLYDVYNRLLRLIGRNIDKTKNVTKLNLIDNLSHEELASLVGSVRKVVNRNLQKLKEEGVIELSRKHIKLKNLQDLLEKLKY